LRWQIVKTKNPGFDGAFYFGVRTTNIFCKPSCASRLPRRENVHFFATSEEAEKGGFRACLRCRPTRNISIDPNAELVFRAFEIIRNAGGEEIPLENLSANLSVSPSHLQKTFKRILGFSPKQFSDWRKIESFKREVKNSDVTTALYESGYGSSRGLYENAHSNLGMTPAVYRKGGKGMKINFTVLKCQLGELLVAATEKGVCSVAFGDDAEVLESNLKQEFPAAQIMRDGKYLSDYSAAILENIAGERKLLHLPIDLQATVFQTRVWAEIKKIPYGETRSYKEIAENLGNAKAVRAVARACASNPVALVTPCHRVVGAKGNLSGYRWGAERKKAILEKEKL
jgi:AraC family transcriptional regulator, regulatory protein of adaptative response / methylated-DNA-[protein]-cysteine methyltransferase